MVLVWSWPVLDGSGLVHKRLVQTGPRTAKDCLRLVLNGPSLSPTTLWSVLDQSGPGLSKKAKRPDRTGLLNTTYRRWSMTHSTLTRPSKLGYWPSLTLRSNIFVVMTVTVPTPICPILTCLRPSRVIRITPELSRPVLPNRELTKGGSAIASGCQQSAQAMKLWYVAWWWWSRERKPTRFGNGFGRCLASVSMSRRGSE